MHFLSALVERSAGTASVFGSPLPPHQQSLESFGELIECVEKNENFSDTDLLFDFLCLAWEHGPDSVTALLRDHSSMSLREAYWKHPIFDSCRDALDREIQTMKPIKPTEEGIYQCSKCGSRQTSVVKAQTRSADEGMTDFVTCHNCGKKWKVNN